jgi:xanthine dehydrogenase YagS FAD-binding subunit
MRPFLYERAKTPQDAILAARDSMSGGGTAADAPVRFIAGGTTLLDLMKLGIMRPDRLVDINPLGLDRIEADARALRLGGLVRMSQAAGHEVVQSDYPVIAQALELAASAQLRNMASLAGNVLQRTRCLYFRDPGVKQCNKRAPGTGCAAIGGENRLHAVLGTSEHCIATYPGDLAVALIALGAGVEVLGPEGSRTLPFADLHRPPGDTPHIETTLQPDEIITALVVPAGPWTRRSRYVKVRDRASYEFALASAAVALDMDGDAVREARIGLGGVATKPWRAHEAEERLRGRPLTEESAGEAARAAFADAVAHEHNAFKIPLGQRTLVRALIEAASLEV